MHDLGGAFKKDHKFILDERSEKVIPFPAEQHGESSVLDNKLNAVAKTKWRKERHNTDFSWDSFLLFVELHRVDQESISSWWTFNFLLDVPHLTLAAVEKRLKESNGRLPVRQELADRYDQQYSIWLQDHDEVELVMKVMKKEMHWTVHIGSKKRCANYFETSRRTVDDARGGGPKNIFATNRSAYSNCFWSPALVIENFRLPDLGFHDPSTRRFNWLFFSFPSF